MHEQPGDSIDCPFCSFPVLVRGAASAEETRCPGCGARSVSGLDATD